MSDSILNVEHLSLRLNSRKHPVKSILEDISFSVAAGKTLALLGESGCGKSMTALALSQLLPLDAEIADKSKILWQGRDMLQLPEIALRHIRGREIAMIFQEPMTALNPVLTIAQQLIEAIARDSQHTKQSALDRAESLLTQVGIAAAKRRLHEYPHQLSGGMKQRVAIAMALASEPKLLIADEPTTALDVTIQAEVLKLIRAQQKLQAMAIVLITHDLGVVWEMADHVAVMYAGQIVEQAPRDLFFTKPLHPYTQLLHRALPSLNKRDTALAAIEGTVPQQLQLIQGCRFRERCPSAMAICAEVAPTARYFTADRSVACHLYTPEISVPVEILKKTLQMTAPQKSHAQTVLTVTGLQQYFPVGRRIPFKSQLQLKAVDVVDLTLQAGKTLALVGESGCGKTTLGKSIIRLLKPTSGNVKLFDIDLASLSHKALRPYRRHIQMIFQDPYASLNPRLIIRDSIAEGIVALGDKLSKAELEDQIATVLAQVGLPADSQHRYPHEFSGGQRQRICIARALAIRPKILICDEPTSALDVSVQAQIINLLKSVQHEYQLAYLFISHNLAVVSYLADTIAVMYLGRIVEYGKAELILRSPKHPYTQALLSAVPEPLKERSEIPVDGEIPSALAPPSGCHFRERCPHALPICHEQYPVRRELSPEHGVNCHLY